MVQFGFGDKQESPGRALDGEGARTDGAEKEIRLGTIGFKIRTTWDSVIEWTVNPTFVND